MFKFKMNKWYTVKEQNLTDKQHNILEKIQVLRSIIEKQKEIWYPTNAKVTNDAIIRVDVMLFLLTNSVYSGKKNVRIALQTIRKSDLTKCIRARKGEKELAESQRKQLKDELKEIINDILS